MSPRVSFPAAPASLQKTGRVRGILQGELLRAEDLVAVHPWSAANLRRGNQEQVGLGVAEHLIGELRQLSRRPHRCAVNQKRRYDLRVAASRRTRQEEVHDRA